MARWAVRSSLPRFVHMSKEKKKEKEEEEEEMEVLCKKKWRCCLKMARWAARSSLPKFVHMSKKKKKKKKRREENWTNWVNMALREPELASVVISLFCL
jgi:hypothetical protein